MLQLKGLELDNFTDQVGLPGLDVYWPMALNFLAGGHRE